MNSSGRRSGPNSGRRSRSAWAAQPDGPLLAVAVDRLLQRPEQRAVRLRRPHHRLLQEPRRQSAGPHERLLDEPVQPLRARLHAQVDPHGLEPVDGQHVAVRQQDVALGEPVRYRRHRVDVGRVTLVELARAAGHPGERPAIHLGGVRRRARHPARDVARTQRLRRHRQVGQRDPAAEALRERRPRPPAIDLGSHVLQVRDQRVRAEARQQVGAPARARAPPAPRRPAACCRPCRAGPPAPRDSRAAPRPASRPGAADAGSRRPGPPCRYTSRGRSSSPPRRVDQLTDQQLHLARPAGPTGPAAPRDGARGRRCRAAGTTSSRGRRAALMPPLPTGPRPTGRRSPAAAAPTRGGSAGRRRAACGCTRGCGAPKTASRSPSSTICPCVITATRVAICRTTARSCAMNRYVSPSSRCRSRSRLITCAWTDTSRADTASSHTTHPRADRQRAGDPDALGLPAGELRRVLLRVVRVEPHPLHEGSGERAGAARDRPPLVDQGSGDYPLHGVPRVERGERVLEHDLHLAAEPVQLAPLERR